MLFNPLSHIIAFSDASAAKDFLKHRKKQFLILTQCVLRNEISVESNSAADCLHMGKH